MPRDEERPRRSPLAAAPPPRASWGAPQSGRTFVLSSAHRVKQVRADSPDARSAQRPVAKVRTRAGQKRSARKRRAR